MNETVNSFDQAYSDIESMKSLSQELRKELEVTRNVIEGSKAGYSSSTATKEASKMDDYINNAGTITNDINNISETSKATLKKLQEEDAI